MRAEEEAKARGEDDMIKQLWRANSLGAEMRGVKPEMKSAVSEAQEMAKAETDISSIFKRKRERRERGQKLRQGLGLRLRSGKRQRGKGRRQGPTRSLIMRKWIGQERGPRLRQSRRQILLGCTTGHEDHD